MNIRKRNKHLKSVASEGGKARALALSPERRKEIAKRAVEIRWNRKAIW